MLTGRHLTLGAGLYQPLQAGFNQFAAGSHHAGNHLLSRHTAFNKHRPPLPTTDAPAITGQPLQRQLDAVPARRWPSNTPVDR